MNCIEADNEIHLVPDRLFILEEKINKLSKNLSLLYEIIETKHDLNNSYMRLMFNDIEKRIPERICDKCHGKGSFVDNGIL